MYNLTGNAQQKERAWLRPQVVLFNIDLELIKKPGGAVNGG